MDPEEEMRKLAEEASADAKDVPEDEQGDSGHISAEDMKGGEE